MTVEPQNVEKQEFKSPQRKLVTFFEKSRNNWKSKFAKAKKDLKRQENRIRFLEQGREKWKEEAKRLKAEMTDLKKGLKEEKAGKVEAEEKKLNLL